MIKNAANVTLMPTGIFDVDTGEENQDNTDPGAVYEVLAGGSLAKLTTSHPINDPFGIAYDPVRGNLWVLDDNAGRSTPPQELSRR